ncbi:FHA domain-containing protein [Streptomyces sp. NBC_01255]|uniref:FHA domain-containing protein n=1 Tax=Streptomyces sp. NBC_01255 TaxID=2903798 RepID=UPI002E35BC42|nr:FHA domain-containing protein [Streptomyces sp. NBC_01255]
MGERPVAPAAPALILEIDGDATLMDPSRVYRIGRDPTSDFVLSDARASWHHAQLRAVAGHWDLADEGSTNGTFTNGLRVSGVREVGPGTVVRFGHPQDGPRAVLSTAPRAHPPAPPTPEPPHHEAPPPEPPVHETPRPEPPSHETPVHEAPVPAPPVPEPAPPEPAPPEPAPLEPSAPAPPVPAAPLAEPPAAEPLRPSSVSYPAATGTFRQPTSVRPLPAHSIRIGRAPDNDVVVSDLVVSRRHAELRAKPDGTYWIHDLGSHNGTFLNGRRVVDARVTAEDIVGVGRCAFCLIGGQLVEFTDNGEISLDVQELAVTVDHGRKTLLDEVSFPVGQKCLLAVVGPSGAGKSTLLGALTGQRPADRGTVLYDGRDLYRDYAELRQRIGLVPQDDILHLQLTVRRALGYAAELRFPEDTAPAERRARVDEVIRELGLVERAEQPIHSLSGGQRKRVSVALELLTKPSLLFLDEPTSGLDPGMDRSVMHMLRGLADDGRTVVVVTHSVLSLDVCDRLLVLAPGGRVAYYGPPADTLGFFGYTQWPEAFEAFENDRERDWAGQYRSSHFHRRYVSDATARPLLPTGDGGPSGAVPLVPETDPPPKAQSWGSQLRTLVRRYTAALSADRTFLAIMIALPFVMGAMARALSEGELNPESTLNVLLILCVGGVLTGAANAVRELVKERTIYRRERAVGLSRSAYLASKVVVLGLITVVQAVVLTLVALIGVPLNVPGGKGVLLPPLVEITLAVALLSFTAMMLGLLVSAVVRKEEVTMPLLVLLAIVQVVFCGALLSVRTPGLEQLAWLVPSRWAFAAMGATLDIGEVAPTDKTDDPLMRHTLDAWLFDMGMLVVICLALGVVVARLLRRHEPVVMRR